MATAPATSTPPSSSNIWIAASEGNIDHVAYFLEQDATLLPTSADNNTYTPLHAAASYGHLDLIRYLLNHKKCPPREQAVNVEDEDGETPLFVTETTATAKVLIEEFGADYKRKNKEGNTISEVMEDNGWEQVAEYIRSLTGEVKPSDTIDEEEEEEDEEEGSAAAGAIEIDDEKHDGEVTKKYVELLSEFGSCELSDALIKLSHPTGGHIPDISLLAPSPFTPSSSSKVICGQVFTVRMVASSDTAAPKPAQHFVDAAPEGSVMVVQAPPEAANAVWGGLMTERAKFRGVKGVIVDGKIRDLQEQWSSGMTIFAKGHSTLGQSPFTRPSELGCSLQFPGSTSSSIFPASTLEPTDLILADVDGVVFVPRALVTEVARLAKEGREVDERCKQDIVKGRPVKETFAEHRGKK